MSEHMHQKKEDPLDFFAMMGRTIPFSARQVGYEYCKAMGLDSARSFECVGAVAEQLARDKPYEAQAAGMKFLDLTGTYRLFAVLLSETAAAIGRSESQATEKEQGND